MATATFLITVVAEEGKWGTSDIVICTINEGDNCDKRLPTLLSRRI